MHLVDGHNRYAICQRENIKFKTREIELPSREHVRLWIETNTLARRNLSPTVIKVLVHNIRKRRSELAKKERASKGGKASVNSYTTDTKAVRKKRLVDKSSTKRNGTSSLQSQDNAGKLPERRVIARRKIA